MLGILANPQNQDFLTEEWVRLGKESYTVEDNKPIPFVEPTGLRYESFWLGGEHLVFLIHFPTARHVTEADYAVITTSPKIRYLTAEQTLPDERGKSQHVIGEWIGTGTHANHGHYPKMSVDQFLHAVCRMIHCSETIEPPTSAQQEGLSRQGPTINMTMPPNLPREMQSQFDEWDEAGDQAMMDEGDLPKAEHYYRQCHELMMRELGPTNTKATLTYYSLSNVIGHQGRFVEMEQMCREWWRHCRRHRILGHYESMMSVQSLASAIAAQGRKQEALEILKYRAQLLGLARGARSADAVHARELVEEFASGGDGTLQKHSQ